MAGDQFISLTNELGLSFKQAEFVSSPTYTWKIHVESCPTFVQAVPFPYPCPWHVQHGTLPKTKCPASKHKSLQQVVLPKQIFKIFIFFLTLGIQAY